MYSLRKLRLKLQKPVLSNLSLEIKKGELVHIAGPNGSGKTSLLRLLSGLIPSVYPGEWEGEVLFEDQPLEEASLQERCALTGSWAASRLFCHNVWEEVTFTPGNTPRRAEELLKYFGIWEFRERHPQKLSGGQQQLVLLTAYLAGDRDILFLDEIYAQLSRDKAELLTKLLLEQHRKGTTILLVDHKLPPELEDKARTIVLESDSPPFLPEFYALPPCVKEVDLRWKDLQPLQEKQSLFAPLSGELPPGQLIHIRGGIGTGKTSFLNAVAGLLPYKGEIRIDGIEGRKTSWEERAGKIGVVSQISDNQFFCSTVKKEIFYGPRKLRRLDKDWLERLIETCGLSHLTERSPYTLSHGEMKRLQLAIALSLKPGILLMDEPETNLDAPSRKILEQLITQYLAMGNRILLVSHSLQIPGSRDIGLKREES